MRVPTIDGDLYARDGEVQLVGDVLCFVTSSGESHVLDIPAMERDERLAKVHGCVPWACMDRSHTWRAR